MHTTSLAYAADYVASRSRLTTFFRLLLAIPHFVVAVFIGIGMWFAVIVAWFALLFTGRWPAGLYNFVAGGLRYKTRLSGYLFLVTDAYPPFDLGEHPEYPVRLLVPEPKPSYSRAKVLFRLLLAIPVYIIAYAMIIVAEVGALLAWFAIVVLGRQPEGLQKMIDLGVSYTSRANGYYALVIEDWPSFSATE